MAIAASERLGADRTVRSVVPPAVQHGYLVPARVRGAKVRHLRPAPVAFPAEVLLEGRQLLEAVAVLARAIDVIRARAVAQRGRRYLVQRLLEGIRAEARRVPGDDHCAGHHRPT